MDTNTIRRDAALLEPLVDAVLEAACRPEQEIRKRLWADHQALRKPGRIPVCVYYEGIPTPQWEAILGPGSRLTEDPIARGIEFDLRRTLWMARNVPDDHIVWNQVAVPAAEKSPVSWGVPLHWEGDGDPAHARKIDAPFAGGIDAARVSFTPPEVDDAESRRRLEMARALTGGRLAVHVRWPDIGHSPFDLAVRMCGLEGIMYYIVDCPQKVLDLMDRITAGHEAFHKAREASGWLHVHPEGGWLPVGFRVHCVRVGEDFDPARPLMRDEWAYVSAQTASGLGPDMFDRFVHVFNQRLARFYTRKSVYFHGCECLDQKMPLLSGLANLRRFHVSPWSSVARAREVFRGSVVLEVHSHPGEVFFGDTREDVRRKIRSLVAAAEGVPMDLNLSDIHTVNGKPEMLRVWAEEARAVSAT